MTLAERLRQKFVDAGYPVSPRDDVGIPAMSWYLGKSPKTLANWRAATPRIGPRFARNGGAVRYALDAILQWEIDRSED